MQEILRYLAILSFLITFLSLSFLILKTFTFGRKPLLAKPAGKSSQGIIYAFGQGMLPWEKESARRHPASYLAGIVYHAGLFSALLYSFSLVIPFLLNKVFLTILSIAVGSGLLGGLGLFLKRLFSPFLRKISCPDDFAANILVNLFLFMTLIDIYTPRLRIGYFIVIISMFLYIPLGKIRHCFFFFYSRILFGLFFGRRGVLPLTQK